MSLEHFLYYVKKWRNALKNKTKKKQCNKDTGVHWKGLPLAKSGTNGASNISVSRHRNG